MEVDKNSFKVLRYINKYSGSIPYQDIFTKFAKISNPNIDESVYWLDCHKFIRIEYSDTNENGCQINPDRIFSTIEGKSVIEERLSRNNSDIFARTIAIIAIFISIVSIVISVILNK